MEHGRRRFRISLPSKAMRLGAVLWLVAGAVVFADGAPRSSAEASSPVHGGAAGAPASSSHCRTDPLAGVYHPWRLHLIRPCLTVTGTVERVRKEPDHDWHINLRLSGDSSGLVNAENRRWEHGDLVVEVIPMDQGLVPRPRRGERITVTGAYVLDTDHGWTEIHPAWIIDGHGSLDFTPGEARKSVMTGIDGNAAYFDRRRARD